MSPSSCLQSQLQRGWKLPAAIKLEWKWVSIASTPACWWYPVIAQPGLIKLRLCLAVIYLRVVRGMRRSRYTPGIKWTYLHLNMDSESKSFVGECASEETRSDPIHQGEFGANGRCPLRFVFWIGSSPGLRECLAPAYCHSFLSSANPSHISEPCQSSGIHVYSCRRVILCCFLDKLWP